MNFKTGLVRLYSENLKEPKKYDNAKESVYDCAVLIKKDDAETIDAISKSIEENPEIKGFDVHDLLRDCADEDKYKDRDDCKDCYILRLKSKFPPQLFGSTNIYRGEIVKLTGSVYQYNQKGRKGISANLKTVLLTGKGDEIKPYNPYEEEIENGEIDTDNLPF